MLGREMQGQGDMLPIKQQETTAKIQIFQQEFSFPGEK